MFVQTALAQDGYGSTSVYDRVVQLPTDKHLFVLPPYAAWNEQRWKDSVYRFPSFLEGRVEMSKGSPSLRPVMNFNIFLGTIEILAADHSLTTIAQRDDIKCVWIGDHKFIYKPPVGYLEILLEGKVSIAQRTIMNGIYESTNGFRYSLRATDLYKSPPQRELRYYWIEEQYYLIDEDQKTYRATKNALTKLAPSVKKQIKAFSDENNIDYTKKEDLMKIVAYTNEQTAAVN